MTAIEKSTDVDIESENNQRLNSDNQQSKHELVEWRYSKGAGLASKGVNQSDIANILKLDKSTISKDFKRLRKQAKEGIKEYIEEVLPLEHKKAIVSFDEVLSRAWLTVSQNQNDPRIVLQALNVISDATMKRQQVLGDPAYIERSIKFVASLKRRRKRRPRPTWREQGRLALVSPLGCSLPSVLSNIDLNQYIRLTDRVPLSPEGFYESLGYLKHPRSEAHK